MDCRHDGAVELRSRKEDVERGRVGRGSGFCCKASLDQGPYNGIDVLLESPSGFSWILACESEEKYIIATTVVFLYTSYAIMLFNSAHDSP